MSEKQRAIGLKLEPSGSENCSPISRVFTDSRGKINGGWSMHHLKANTSNAPPWYSPFDIQQHHLVHENLLQKSSAKLSNNRIHPYEKKLNIKFTLQDVHMCLYGKQDIKVIQIADEVPSPVVKTNNRTPCNSNNNEDKNKPAKWCDMCQEIRFGECPQHGPLPSLQPSITLPGPKSYAVSTFPDEVGLCISSLPLAGYGVFAKHFIPVGTWIGPYEGKKISAEEGLKQISRGDAPFLWEIYENNRLSHFLDASDENTSSWMRFIQCARHKREQNLYVFQYYGSIYYRAFKDIIVGQELLLWYDEKYPQYFGIPEDIRDMSSCTMESIQAPVEVSKSSIENEQMREIFGTKEMVGSFMPDRKFVTKLQPNIHERGNQARIPFRNPMYGQRFSSSYMPPTLSQAPIKSSRPNSGELMEGRLVFTRKEADRVNYHQKLSQSPRSQFNPQDITRAPLNMCRSPNEENSRLKNASDIKHENERKNNSIDNKNHHVTASTLPHHANNLHVSTESAYSQVPPTIMTSQECENKNLPEQTRPGSALNYSDIERSKTLRERMFYKTADNERRPYEDAPCEQTFQQKLPSDRHQYPKQSSKPYQCGKCHLSFQETADLQEHMALHTAERPFKCGICSRCFAGSSALSNHMRMHTSNHRKPNDSYPEQASKSPVSSGKQFQHNQDFNNHIPSNGDSIT